MKYLLFSIVLLVVLGYCLSRTKTEQFKTGCIGCQDFTGLDGSQGLKNFRYFNKTMLELGEGMNNIAALWVPNITWVWGTADKWSDNNRAKRGLPPMEPIKSRDSKVNFNVNTGIKRYTTGLWG